MSRPAIAVIIPTHNRPEELRRAVLSVYHQTQLPNELIIIDDGSVPPVTRDIFQDAPNNLRTVLLRNNVPLGANNARNRGIKNAVSDWIAFLDDDDEFFPNKIEVVLKAIEDNPDCDFFYHPAIVNMVNEKITYTTNPREYNSSDDIFRLLLIKNEIGGTPMVIIRRSKLVEVGGFNKQMPALEDYELWLKIAKSGAKLKKIDQPLTKCNYIRKKRSVSKNIESNRVAISMIEEKYKSDYASFNVYEIKLHEAWKQSMIIHKALLNGKKYLAFKEQIRYFIILPHPKNLLAALIILVSPKILFWLRTKLA